MAQSLLFQAPQTSAPLGSALQLPNMVGALPAADSAILKKDPISGMFSAKAAAPAAPVPPTVLPSTQNNPIQPTTSSTPPAQDPYQIFLQNLNQILTYATQKSVDNNNALLGQKNQIETQSVAGPNGPQAANMQEFAGQAVNDRQGWAAAAAPAITSLSEGMANNTNAMNSIWAGAANLAKMNGNISQPYNEHMVSSVTGLPIGSGAGGILPLTAQSAVDAQVQSYKNQKTNLSAVMSALSAYGQPAMDAFYKGIGSTNINSTEGSAAYQSNQVGDIAKMQSSYQQGQNLQGQLSDLITTFGLNPNDINAANIGLQKIAQNTSSSQYKALANLVTDLVSTYSSILTPGANTDAAKAAAASLLDPTAGGSSILSTLQHLDQQAKAKIAGTSVDPATIAWLVGPKNSTNKSSGSTSGKITSWDQLPI